MKLNLFVMISVVTSLAHAGGSDVGNSGGQTFTANPLSQSIDCKGRTANGTVIGIRAQIGPLDNLESLATYENEAVDIEDVSGATTSYLKLTASGDVAVFALKTYNDGLETNNRVEFVRSSPAETVLELGYRGNLKAVSGIKCQILK